MSTSADTKISPSVASTTTGHSLEQGVLAVATAQVLNQGSPSTIPTSESPITNFQWSHFAATLLVLLMSLTTLAKVYISGSSQSLLPIVSVVNASTFRCNASSLWVPDLTTQGVEPNPGPSKHRIRAEELVLARSRLKPRIPKAPPMVSIRNAPPISRPASSVPRQKMKKMTNLAGSDFNPRADMVGYFQTLCDAENFPPVRLGGETMIQTGLTTLHTVVTIGNGSTTNFSAVVHPRVWNPVLISNSATAPYTWGLAPSGFPASTVTTIQSLAAAARVVSMKVKVYTLNSATTDNGALTIGLCPTDPSFSNTNSTGGVSVGVTGIAQTAGSVGFANINAFSQAGYPITGTGIIGSQGFNEFPAEDWSDTLPLKDGASVFWLPQDPLNLIFKSDRIRQSIEAAPVATGGSTNALQVATVNFSEIQDPFVCLGFSGIAANSGINIEVFLNLEYTVTSGASNVIETKAGSMDSVQAFHVVKRVGGDLQNTVVPDPEASLWDKAKGVGKAMLSGGLNRASEFLFGSSDVGKAVYSLIS